MSGPDQDRQRSKDAEASPGAKAAAQSSADSGIPDPRRFRRVGVKLRVAVVLGRHTAYLARSCDISEGGMQIEGYQGPKLATGRLIGVNMRGVISDTPGEDGEQYLVRVVRHEGESLAVRFVEGE